MTTWRRRRISRRRAAELPIAIPTTIRHAPASCRLSRRDGEKVTIAQVESPRLTVRIDQWIKAPDPSSLSLPALTIGPDGQVEDPTVTTETEARHMADRIHQWLEKDRSIRRRRGPID